MFRSNSASTTIASGVEAVEIAMVASTPSSTVLYASGVEITSTCRLFDHCAAPAAAALCTAA